MQSKQKKFSYIKKCQNIYIILPFYDDMLSGKGINGNGPLTPKLQVFFYYLSVSIPGSDRRLSKFLRRYTVLIVFKIKKLNFIKYCDCREGVCTS